MKWKRDYVGIRISQYEGYQFGGPHNGVIVVWGVYWGPFISGNYHMYPLMLDRFM